MAPLVVMAPLAAMDRADPVAIIICSAVCSVESTAIFIIGTKATTLPTVAMAHTAVAVDLQATPIRDIPMDQAVEALAVEAPVPMYQLTVAVAEVRVAVAQVFITQR
jgi:hypothetical protein